LRLIVKVVSKGGFVAKEVLKDLKTISLINIASLSSSVFLALNICKSFETMFIVDALEVLLA